MKRRRVNGKSGWIVIALTLGAAVGVAWSGVLDGARDLLSGPHIAQRYAELKEDFKPTSIAWSPDGKYIASTGIHTRTINIWDVKKQKVVQSLTLSVPNVPQFRGTLGWSPNGHYLAACAGLSELSMRVWNTATWQVARDFNKDDDVRGCESPVFGRDGRTLIVAQRDAITIYATDTWKLQKRWLIPRNAGRGIEDVALAPDGKTLALAENGYWMDPNRQDGHIAFWNLEEEEPRRDVSVYTGTGSDIVSVAYSPDGKTIAAGKTGLGLNPSQPVVRVLDAANGKLQASLFESEKWVATYALAYTADGKYLIAGHDESSGTVHVVNAKTLQLADVVHAPGKAIGIAVHPTLSMFAVSAGSSIMIWSLNENK